MRKGFTLIELLAVIAILAIILLIAVPYIVNIINDVKTNAFIKDEEMMVAATKNYLAANTSLLPVNVGNTVEVNLSDLQTNNLMAVIRDPKNSTNSCGGYVLVTKTTTGFDYTPSLKCDTSYDSYITDGLVAYYKLDGNAVDASPNNYDGTVVGPIAIGNRFNQTNKAMDFDGTDYIDLGVNPALTPSNITLMAWVKADVLDNWEGIISNMTSWGTGFSLQLGPSQKIAAMISGAYLTTSWQPTTGVWYHIVATHNGVNNMNVLYVNGGYENSMTQAVVYEANAKTYIGVFYTSPNLLLDGIIDDVKIYNRVLSADEVKRSYEVEKMISR